MKKKEMEKKILEDRMKALKKSAISNEGKELSFREYLGGREKKIKNY